MSLNRRNYIVSPSLSEKASASKACAKPGNSLRPRTSGYRSEAIMNFRLFLLVALIAVSSASVLAQNKINPNHLSLRTDTDVETVRSASGFVGNETSAKLAAIRAIEQDAFQLINVERSLAGLPTLRWNEKVAQLARLHSRNMADLNFFSHKGLDGLTVDGRAQQLNVTWQAIGENIAFMQNYPNPAVVAVEKWLESASHRSNMMDKGWSDSAVGVAMTEDGKCYFTQVFLLK